MRTPSIEIGNVLVPFAPFFRYGTWRRAQVLMVGANMAPGKRARASALCVIGLRHAQQFEKYHAVLSPSRWSSLTFNRILLLMLVTAFIREHEAIMLGLVEMVEGRLGQKIKA